MDYSFEYLREPFRVTLVRDISWDGPEGTAAVNSLAALEVLDGMRAVFRPSVPLLSLGCRDRETPEFLRGDGPPVDLFHFRRTGGPAYDPGAIASADRSGFASGAAPCTSARDTTGEPLRAWLAGTLCQTPPDDNAVIVLDQLACWYGSAWLGPADPGRPPPRGILTDGLDPDRTEVTAVSHEGDFWVSGPAPGLGGPPPLSLTVMLDDEALFAHIKASWRPWAQPGTPQHTRLLTALDRLALKGWHRSL
ncbi:hypothetical protein ACIBCM_00985 [Streptomyces sp. NPDC051018]|uniref:hypothetical protein n=1 Tax=Streptomyces sp. NPDC051018 TaxID=3365639 RepID=UPI003787EBEF